MGLINYGFLSLEKDGLPLNYLTTPLLLMIKILVPISGIGRLFTSKDTMSWELEL